MNRRKEAAANDRRKRRWMYAVPVILAVLGVILCAGKLFRQPDAERVSGPSDAEEEARRPGAEAQILAAMKTAVPNSPEIMKSLVEQLGETGYTAIDSENQINMAGAEQMMEFCRKAEEGRSAEITVYSIFYGSQFTRYTLEARDGQLNITEKYYAYETGSLSENGERSYPAVFWDYQDGYLFFEKEQMAGYDGASGHTALRVQPLDEDCREWNRKYILPVGYEKNDLFLSDWSEEAFGTIDFYDLFDIFYPEVYGKPVPYTAGENCSEGAVYRIPGEEFERVLQTHFRIDRETLQESTVYDPKDGTYEYRPRGFYDCEQPNCPYPEVTAGEEREDGTLVLTVHAVYPDGNSADVYAHEVVIRPLEDGGFQYVSNRVLTPEKEKAVFWRTDRLTEEQWEELYGKI